MTALQKLSRPKRAIAYTAIALGLPFVCLWRGWVRMKWVLWAGRIYRTHHHGRR